MKKLYVGNLPFSTTEDDLKQMFAPYGEVTTVTIIKDKFSGRSKGFGFVEMSTDEEATKAVEMFNGQDLDGRQIVVNEARPMAPRAPRTGGTIRTRPDCRSARLRQRPPSGQSRRPRRPPRAPRSRGA